MIGCVVIACVAMLAWSPGVTPPLLDGKKGTVVQDGGHAKVAITDDEAVAPSRAELPLTKKTKDPESGEPAQKSSVVALPKWLNDLGRECGLEQLELVAIGVGA